MRKITVVAAMLMLLSPIAAYAGHHNDGDESEYRGSSEHHGYSIHSDDPRQNCWKLKTEGGPKGKSLLVCEDK